MHLHLLGRSPRATHPAWRWGECPVFPRYAERFQWSSQFERLTADECTAVVARVQILLGDVYGFVPAAIRAWSRCATCAYPLATARRLSPECHCPCYDPASE